MYEQYQRYSIIRLKIMLNLQKHNSHFLEINSQENVKMRQMDIPATKCSDVQPLVKNEKQEGQLALNRSPEFCLKLTYRNLLKADHVPGDTWGKPFLVPRALFEQARKRSTR